MSPEGPRRLQLRDALFGLYVVCCLAALTWPGYDWLGNRIEPLVLGVPFFSTELTIWLHPVAFAGWLGMFFTALNLLPLGQLDGGHVVYSMFGARHTLIARLFFVVLLVMGFYWSGWWVWAVLVLLMGLKHPRVLDESVPLLKIHRVIGWVSIAVLLLTFIPVPIDLIR